MATTTLKYDYAPQANEVTLMTNILVYLSQSSSKASSSKNILVLKSQGVTAFYWLNIYFWTRAHLATLSN